MYDNRPTRFTEQARRNRELIERRRTRNESRTGILVGCFGIIIVAIAAYALLFRLLPLVLPQ